MDSLDGSNSLDGDNVWRDGFVSSFTMILLAEIADKTFFIAAILGRVLMVSWTGHIQKCQNFCKCKNVRKWVQNIRFLNFSIFI